MYKVKRSWKRPFVDLTPLCDISVIILLFFSLGTRSSFWKPTKIEEPLITVTPNFTSPQSRHGGTVFVGKYGKVMYGILDTATRRQTLLQMGELYHIKFSAAEVEKFSKIESIGVPVVHLKEYLKTNYSEKSFSDQPGIPVDPKNNELISWVYQSRIASRNIHGHDLQIAIDADKSVLYPNIENIFNSLEKQELFIFRLITTIKSSNDKSPESDAMQKDEEPQVVY